MKKNKYIKISCLLLFIFICTGCVRFNGEMEISNTKRLDLKIDYAVNKKYVDQDVFTEEEIKELESFGYDVDEYKKDNYEGITLRYRVKNIDKISSRNNITYSLTDLKKEKPKKMFRVRKGWFVNEYRAHFKFDATDVGALTVKDDSTEALNYLCDDGSVITITKGESIKEGCRRVSKIDISNIKSKALLSNEDLYKKVRKGSDLKFVVKLEKSAISNNATKAKKNDTELIWKLDDEGVTNINFEFRLYNYFNIVLTIIFCLIIIIVCSYYIISFINSKKDKKNKKKKEG